MEIILVFAAICVFCACRAARTRMNDLQKARRYWIQLQSEAENQRERARFLISYLRRADPLAIIEIPEIRELVRVCRASEWSDEATEDERIELLLAAVRQKKKE